MAYRKHYFQTGGKIEAAPFNEMENQIAANEAAVAGKQDKLTLDHTPTAGSTNPITSGGVQAALDALAGNVRGVYYLTEINPEAVIGAYNAFQNGCYVARKIQYEDIEICLSLTHAVHDTNNDYYLLWFETTTNPISRSGRVWQGNHSDSPFIHSVSLVDCSRSNSASESLSHYVVCTPLEMSRKQDKLPDEYIAYLEEATYKKPSIVSLSVTSVGGEVEIGTEITVGGITHEEENPENIAGALTLKHGDAVLSSSIPVAAPSASYTLDTPYHFTRRTAGTETLTLSGENKRGNVFSKSAAQHFYVPKFTGASTSAAVTAEDILSMQRAKTLQSSVTISEDAAFVYFITDGGITSVKSGGFDVPFVAAGDVIVSINGIDVTYHVYRAENQAVPGTYSFEII